MSISEKILRGLIPWSKDEFNAVHLMWHKILQKPKDDWDLTSRKTHIYVQTLGETHSVEISPFHPYAQLNAIILKRYPDKKLGQSYMVRFFKMITFLQGYIEDLRKEGFAQRNGNIDYFKNELIISLCALPYSFEKLNSSGNKDFHFVYSQVVDHAWELIKG